MIGVALITGAASGIGQATAETFVKEGCTKLALADIDEGGLQTVADKLHAINPDVQVVTVKVDVSSESDVQYMVSTAVAKFGAIHYAVNNAGISSKPREKTHELATHAWDQVIVVNLRGVWLCERAEIQQMLRQKTTIVPRTGAPPQRGSIVNVSSIFGVLSHPTVGGYAAAKAGVLGISRTDAVAYGAEGIRVNSVLPGFIKTPLLEEAIRQGSNYDDLIKTVPVRRWGTSQEVSEVIAFLAGEKASFINGSEVLVDGGYSKI
ncbi:SDR family NAD(P)-dependent oxidoreductase [Aspergillus candidus]|uniref:Short chain dehydrogenase/ reductase n=1 Tax=Aspergillus candidus TaxID=41067 RepID=A0A2I2FIB6_ASPCN|nr:short chain dehydrogenase/ reductase [Aspergillus candidus]PLB40360.1 short chain dehydrogenase/ reductase [Aspergillus candidus]